VKRSALKVVALAVVLVVGVVATPVAGAAAPPGPEAGGPAALLRFAGDPSSATGAALASGPCDVNGDGYDDVVVGAWFWDKTPTANIGASYVILGGPDVDGASLADPAEAGAVRIDGPATASAFTGFAVGCLGDVNGDDLDDIAISHYTAQRAYVVFGAEELTGLTLDSIGDRGFTVLGGPSSGNVGFSLNAVGDLDADGLDDFAVAEVAADTQGRTNNGRVWVVAGRDDISDVDLLAPAEGDLVMTVDGAISEERIGTIAQVGDVNGDDVDDFLLGSYTSTPWGASVAVPGAAYVVFGGTTGTVDTAALGDDGFTIVGPTRQRDRLGISVAGAGDVDGDGLADLLIGADGVNNAATGPRAGGAAVVFGSASTARVYTDPAAASGQSVFTCANEGPITDPGTCGAETRRGYWIDGAVNQDSTGYSVAGIGDVDGDDVPDMALGAYGFDTANPTGGTFSGAGATYVVHGDPDAVTVPLATLPADGGYRIDGTLNGDRFGRQVAALGDVDGNGTADVAIGADFAKRPDAATGDQNGEVTVALMGRLAATVAVTGPASAQVGDEVTFTATMAQPAAGGTEVATGTVAFRVDGVVIAGCGEVAVVAGTASCTTTFTTGVTGPVEATYSGTDLLQAGTGELPFTVAPPRTADESWVLAAHDDLLGRTPTEQERADAVARLGAGTSRATVARELSRTTEWIEVSITRFYADTLDREPDAAGLAFWVDQVQSGRRTLAAVAAQLYSSPEYHGLAGGTDAEWIADLYEKVLHRPAQPDDIVFWVDQTEARGRGKVAAAIYGSLESRRDRVVLLYELLLGRAPDTDGLAYWAGRIVTTGDLALAVNLVVSPEYVGRAQVRFP
jgi:hypothetical protein